MVTRLCESKKVCGAADTQLQVLPNTQIQAKPPQARHPHKDFSNLKRLFFLISGRPYTFFLNQALNNFGHIVCSAHHTHNDLLSPPVKNPVLWWRAFSWSHVSPQTWKWSDSSGYVPSMEHYQLPTYPPCVCTWPYKLFLFNISSDFICCTLNCEIVNRQTVFCNS